MNENAKKWVEALRSGEFGQGQGCLRNNNGFCCLGVACELYRQETGDGEWLKGGDRSDGALTFRSASVPGNGGTHSILTNDVRVWLGLADSIGSFDPLSPSTLAALNDRGVSFEQIANTIEAEPEGLFNDE